MTQALPVEAVLPDLLAKLCARSNLVLVAPPGAGKTTMVPPALLDAPWCSGTILLLSPRRIAARAAAERIAHNMGEKVGGQVGYATRLESRQSRDTRILVLTEGIFLNRIQSAPDLPGVSAVLFDEVHERSLDSDFGLALALDAQAAFRPDLRLIAMSATIDGARFGAILDAPIVESAGRSWPLTLRHLPRRGDVRIEAAVASAVRQALSEEAQGDVLAFLPGVGEIERTARALEGIAADVFPLHGSLDPAGQRAALRGGDRRKVILATAIAETSLTIDGVRIVIDSGLARRARYDRDVGITRLVTERASRAAVDQRAGRAARQGPGVAYRLWEPAATTGLAAFDPPEILQADLAALTLDCALWGEGDPARLNWLDPPPAAALAEAKATLTGLGALDADGRVTDHGRAIAKLPLPVRLSHMLLIAPDFDCLDAGLDLCILLSERRLGGLSADLEQRARRWRTERSARAEAARRLKARWRTMLGGGSAAGATGEDGAAIARAIALAFPNRVARRRDRTGEQWLSVGGRGFRLDPADPLASAEWLAVAEVQGAAAGARIQSAAVLDIGEVERLFGPQMRQETRVCYDPASTGVRAESGRWLGAIALVRGQAAGVEQAAIATTLADAVRAHGLEILPWGAESLRLRARAQWAGLTSLDEASLVNSVDDWLPPLLAKVRRLTDVPPAALHQMLLGRLDWQERQQLDRIAPEFFTAPAGSTHAIDYAAEGGPVVTVRVQAMFGCDVHPCIGQPPVPLVLSLTSPAGRSIQTTRDLPGFWRGSWQDVQREMRGRYPKHPWPDHPHMAIATVRTKAADARRQQALHKPD